MVVKVPVGEPVISEDTIKIVAELRLRAEKAEAALASTAQQMADCVERCERLERERKDTRDLESAYTLAEAAVAVLHEVAEQMAAALVEARNHSRHAGVCATYDAALAAYDKVKAR